MKPTAKPKMQTLSEFLGAKNLPSALSLPWVHSTSATNLFKIIEDEKLLALNCNVFKGEKLCYLFMGRPAYKLTPNENPSDWQLPVVFVVRFSKPPPLKRVFPFDSGAFKNRLLPGYISAFGIDGFNLAGDPNLVGRLVSFYFKTPSRYVARKAVGDDELKEDHNLDMRHAQILALGRLYREGSTSNLDDRAAAIEVQLADDVKLAADNLLGVVVPSEYLRTPGVKQSLKQLTKYVESYDHFPLGMNEHYGLIYNCVNQIYKKAGVKI
jgi:hypothetical protein